MAADDILTLSRSWGLNVENCCGISGLKPALQRVPDGVSAVDALGASGLHHASYNGNVDKVKLLIAAGAKVNLQDKHGQTALHYAAQLGQDEVVTELLQAGADKKLKDKDGIGAAALARVCGYKDVSKQIKGK